MRRSADLPRRHCQQASSDDAEGAAMQRADAQTSQYAGAIGWRTGCRRARHDDANGGKCRRWLCADQVCAASRSPLKANSASLAGARHGDLQGQVTSATAVATADAVSAPRGTRTAASWELQLCTALRRSQIPIYKNCGHRRYYGPFSGGNLRITRSWHYRLRSVKRLADYLAAAHLS